MQKAEKKSPAKAGKVELEAFNFSEGKAPIRVQVVNGEPWFIGKDICEVLGLINHRDALSRLDDDERRGVGITDPIGRRQTAIAVSESGLYHLIFQGYKPEAKKFRRWVTREVLPTIRKYGSYVAGQQNAAVIDARDVPYEKVNFMDREVKTVNVEGKLWYCLADLSHALGNVSTCKVKGLNAKRTLARKLWAYSTSAPAWYVNELGVKLLLCSKGKMSGQTAIDFERKEVRAIC